MTTREKIKLLIERGGFTQSELSEKSNVSQATISRILSGKHSWVRPSTDESISSVYDATFAKVAA